MSFTITQCMKETADHIINFDESGISTVLDMPKVLAAWTQK